MSIPSMQWRRISKAIGLSNDGIRCAKCDSDLKYAWCPNECVHGLMSLHEWQSIVAARFEYPDHADPRAVKILELHRRGIICPSEMWWQLASILDPLHPDKTLDAMPPPMRVAAKSWCNTKSSDSDTTIQRFYSLLESMS